MSILLDERTRVLVQGITGFQARTHVQYMVKYGTRVVGGVSPGKRGETVGDIPVYDSVAQAVSQQPVDLAVLFVPARAAAEAALDAIDHGVRVVLVLAEGIPHHDTARVLRRARDRGVRLIGPNSQGMLSPGKAKLGGSGGQFPERMYRPGPVGIVSRSGGMGGEIASALTRAGIGQSTYVSIGGDLLIGTTFADLLPLYEADPATEAVVLFGEPGTGHEEAAAELIATGAVRKPVVAFVAGESVEGLPRGMTLGHTGAVVARGLGSPSRKKVLLREAGARVAERFTDIPRLVAEALAERGWRPAAENR